MISDSISNPKIGDLIIENDFRSSTIARKIIEVNNNYVVCRSGIEGEGRRSTISKMSLTKGRYRKLEIL